MQPIPGEVVMRKHWSVNKLLFFDGLLVSFSITVFSVLGTEEGLILRGLGFVGFTLYLEPTYNAFSAHGKIKDGEGNQRSISSLPCFSLGKGSFLGTEIPIRLLVLSDRHATRAEVRFLFTFFDVLCFL